MIPDGMRHQWWLAELDRYGNPTLCDGAHGERSGAERALHIYQRLGSAWRREYAVAEVFLTDVVPSPEGIDEEALDACVDMVKAVAE